jgi:hypothetical protein
MWAWGSPPGRKPGQNALIRDTDSILLFSRSAFRLIFAGCLPGFSTLKQWQYVPPGHRHT